VPRAKDAILPPPLRSIVLQLLMVGLLAGSVGLAYAVTGAPPRASAGQTPARTTLGEMSLDLPAAWAFDHAAEPQPGIQLWELINRAAVGQRLRVLRVQTAEPPTAGQLLGALVITPLRNQGRVFLVQGEGDAMLRRYPPAEHSDSLMDLSFSTRLINRTATSPQLNAVQLIQVEPTVSWIFQLSEQVTTESWSRPRESALLEQLRRLTADATYVAG
jgi:hypothetical protein